MYSAAGRMEVIEMHVVLAAPDDLYRLAHLLREQRRFRHVIRLRLASESAAQQRHVALHVFLLDAHRARHGVLHGLRILRAGPGDHLAVFEFGDGGQRFHGGVRQHGRVVGRFERLAALGELRVHVAQLARDAAGLARGIEHGLLVRGRIVSGVLAQIPFDFQFLARLQRGPTVVGDHRRAAQRLETVGRLGQIQHDHLLDALHLFGFGIVAGFQRGAHHRRALDRRIHHARHARVDAENRLARDDRLQIDDGNVFADVAELIGRLQADGVLLRRLAPRKPARRVRRTPACGRSWHAPRSGSGRGTPSAGTPHLVAAAFSSMVRADGAGGRAGCRRNRARNRSRRCLGSRTWHRPAPGSPGRAPSRLPVRRPRSWAVRCGSRCPFRSDAPRSSPCHPARCRDTRWAARCRRPSAWGRSGAAMTSAPAEKIWPRNPRRETCADCGCHACTPAAILIAWRMR